MGAREHYLEHYAERRAALPGAALPWLARAREAALARFGQLGLPTLRDEDWKYTNVAVLDRRTFVGAPVAEADEALRERVERLALEGCHLLVFADGRHLPALSRLGELPEGVRVGSLAAALDSPPAWLAETLGASGEDCANGFVALNAALWTDGALVEVPPGEVLERPLQLLFLAGEGEGDAETAAFPRNLIRLGAGARVAVIEHYAGGAAPYLTDAVTRIDLGEGAKLEHARFQEEGARAFHVAELRAALARDARLAAYSFALGGLLARNDIAVGLAGEGSAAELTGLYLAAGRQHQDHHTRIDHLSPQGTSREFFKGVVDEAGRAVFHGRVVVHPDAQRTDAQQANHNLLLSEAAEVDTKPQLEIYADDVKCSHGATVGQLDPAQLYYLRSRGLNEPAARALLIHAFAAEVVERVTIAPLRARLEDLLRARLPAEPAGATREDKP